MSWASPYVKQLLAGETVSFRPTGNSMTPLVQSGQLCIVSPVSIEEVQVGDVVLCHVAGKTYLHKVLARNAAGMVQIGNNHGRINGWTFTVYGRLVGVSG